MKNLKNLSILLVEDEAKISFNLPPPYNTASLEGYFL
jgi:hypothetical protein